MSVLNFGNKWLTTSLTNKAEACRRGGRAGGWLPEAHVQSPSHSHLVILDVACQRVWGPDSPTWLQMPGFVCEGEESWGSEEKSSLPEGMQELLCESRVLQEAWGPWTPVGCRPRPEDDPSLLRRETRICRSPVKNREKTGGGWWSLRTSLWKIPTEQFRGCKHGPRQEAGAARPRGRVRNNKAGESENQDDLERLWYWFFFFFSPTRSSRVELPWNWTQILYILTFGSTFPAAIFQIPSENLGN